MIYSEMIHKISNMKQVIAFVPIMEYNEKWQEVWDMEYLTTVEMSKKWNISSRRIVTLCIEGRIDGVIKKGKMWLIPADAQKPADARRKKGKITE